MLAKIFLFFLRNVKFLLFYYKRDDIGICTTVDKVDLRARPVEWEIQTKESYVTSLFLFWFWSNELDLEWGNTTKTYFEQEST